MLNFVLKCKLTSLGHFSTPTRVIVPPWLGTLDEKEAKVRMGVCDLISDPFKIVFNPVQLNMKLDAWVIH